jgi:hypothetical protein
MPFDWTAERERLMLLMAIQEANLKPNMQLWSSVATNLGGGLTPSAVRCDYVNTVDSAKILSILSSPFLFFTAFCFPQTLLRLCFMLKVPTLTLHSQKYYKLKNEFAKLGGRGASAPSTLLKPRPGRNKITKSPTSARLSKWKQVPEVATAEVSEPEDEPEPSPKPIIKAIANVAFYKVHKEETEVKREEAKVKDESDSDYIP